MDTKSDQDLLRDYAENGSQPAFEELVRRHIDLVYSVAVRILRHAEGAEDVAQCAFTALAQRAGKVAEHPVLSGWLHLTARNLAVKAARSELRRRAREKEAAAVNRRLADPSDAPWEHVAPHLDAALGELSDADRTPLLLRFFERKTAREIGQTLGINEEAAQKRVARAVDRLRDLLSRRDVRIGTSALVAMLIANVVQSAPETLSAAVARAAGSATGATAAAGQGVLSLSGSGKRALAIGAGLAILGLAAVLLWQPWSAGGQDAPPNLARRTTMQIQLTSVMVADQEKALRFYTEVLGLVMKVDVPAGGARWLTVVSPDEPDGTELLLEPIGLAPARTYQKQLFDAGIPYTSFAVGDIKREYERMRKLGASFKVEPKAAGPTTIAVFDDTCGNLIQLFEERANGGAPSPFKVKIKLSSVLVNDQERALRFYTDVLGFLKKRDMQAGDVRWLTVVSPHSPEGTELALEPMGFPPARTFQAAVKEAGIPLTAFVAADVRREYERLKERGVVFSTAPTEMGPTTVAVFDDTCGNLIQLFQK